MNPKKKNRLGQKFGRLLVVEEFESEIRKDGHGTFARWKCKCECGKVTVVRSNGLVSGTTKSCGCLNRQRIKRKGKKEGGLLRIYRAYKINAPKRNHVFDLTLDQFRDMTKQNCHYCGTPPNKIASSGSEISKYLYNGIDRKDNNKGYTLENCVPCCNTCNYAKYTKSYSEFKKWIENLVNFTLGQKNE